MDYEAVFQWLCRPDYCMMFHTSQGFLPIVFLFSLQVACMEAPVGERYGRPDLTWVDWGLDRKIWACIGARGRKIRQKGHKGHFLK